MKIFTARWLALGLMGCAYDWSLPSHDEAAVELGAERDGGDQRGDARETPRVDVMLDGSSPGPLRDSAVAVPCSSGACSAADAGSGAGGSPCTSGGCRVQDAGPERDQEPMRDAGERGLAPRRIRQLSLGGSHTCLVAAGQVSCWGANESGQLGDGTTITRRTPTVVKQLRGVVEVVAGDRHSCALLDSGTVACWGNNGAGQLGDSSREDSFVPVRVSELDEVVQLASGSAHTCALRTGGTVRCWGNNLTGQLGIGTNDPYRYTPADVSSLREVTEVAAGNQSTCARLSTGSVACWGNNGAGQVGDGTAGEARKVPVMVVGLADAQRLTLGFNFSCALLTDGTGRCWGVNGGGQLGDASLENRHVPTTVVGLQNAAFIEAGSFACAVLRTGAVSCWGQAHESTRMFVPTAVPGLEGVVEVAVGGGHTCVRHADGKVACWGANESGQLGDGTTEARLFPTVLAR